jgi:hypothetical protein
MISLRRSFGHRQVSLYGNGHSKKHKGMIPSFEKFLSKARITYENDHSKKTQKKNPFMERA